MKVAELPTTEALADFLLRRLSKPTLIDKEVLASYKAVLEGVTYKDAGGQSGLTANQLADGLGEWRRAVAASVVRLNQRIQLSTKIVLLGAMRDLRKDKVLTGYLINVLDKMIGKNTTFDYVPGEPERLVGLVMAAALDAKHRLRSEFGLSVLRALLGNANAKDLAHNTEFSPPQLRAEARETLKELRDFATEHDVTFPSSLDVSKLSTNTGVRTYLRLVLGLLLIAYEEKRKEDQKKKKEAQRKESERKRQARIEEVQKRELERRRQEQEEALRRRKEAKENEAERKRLEAMAEERRRKELLEAQRTREADKLARKRTDRARAEHHYAVHFEPAYLKPGLSPSWATVLDPVPSQRSWSFFSAEKVKQAAEQEHNARVLAYRATKPWKLKQISGIEKLKHVVDFVDLIFTKTQANQDTLEQQQGWLTTEKRSWHDWNAVLARPVKTREESPVGELAVFHKFGCDHYATLRQLVNGGYELVFRSIQADKYYGAGPQGTYHPYSYEFASHQAPRVGYLIAKFLHTGVCPNKGDFKGQDYWRIYGVDASKAMFAIDWS